MGYRDSNEIDLTDDSEIILNDNEKDEKSSLIQCKLI